MINLKEISFPYCSDTSYNIATVLEMDATELIIKTIRRWSEQVNSKKTTNAANLRHMERLQSLFKELEVVNEEISRLTKLRLSKSGKGGELDPKIKSAL